VIGNNVTLRFGSTIAREVFVEDDVFIAPNVMTIYSKHTGEKSTGTFIKKGSFIGTAAVLGPNVTIGEGVVIGAQSYVSKDCIDKGIYVGIPARKIR
jgi:maltose O-acetyltransferase